MTGDEEERADEARRNAFLLDATRELLEALRSEAARDPGDEVAEALCRIRLDAAQLAVEGAVDYLTRRQTAAVEARRRS